MCVEGEVDGYTCGGGRVEAGVAVLLGGIIEVLITACYQCNESGQVRDKISLPPLLRLFN